jgi:hypothetical protein
MRTASGADRRPARPGAVPSEWPGRSARRSAARRAEGGGSHRRPPGRPSVDPRQRVWAAGTAYPSREADDALVVNLLGVGALVAGVGVVVGRGRNGSADSGQGGPVRIRGGSSGERWRSGPVRSLMAAVLRRAGPAGGAGQAGDYRAPMT